MWIKALVALLPAAVFLVGLRQLDALQIVSPWQLFRAACVGAAMALASYFINGRTLDGLPIGFTDYSFYIAPVVEEAMKAAFILYLIGRNRIGFVVDAAILGFALGAGFALFENLYYLYFVPQANFGVWLVRGLGTAMMHGGAGAVFAVITQWLIQRRGRFTPVLAAPGLLAAILLHGLYNHFPEQPVLSMVAAVAAIPLVLLVVMSRSEQSADHWLMTDHETQAALQGEDRPAASTARLVATLNGRLEPSRAAQVTEYLWVHAALAQAADDLLLAHERPDVARPDFPTEGLARLHALEKAIGPATLLALRPHLRFSRRELWQIHRLEDAERFHRRARRRGPAPQP